MPAKPKDLTGTRHHHLLILRRGEKRTRSGKLVTVWHCRCIAQGPNCRVTCDVEASNLGRTHSCGCLKNQPRPNPTREAVPVKVIPPALRDRVLEARKTGAIARPWRSYSRNHRVVRSTFSDLWLHFSSEGLSYFDIAAICRSAEGTEKREEDARFAEYLRIQDGLLPTTCCDDPGCADCAGSGNPKTKSRRFAALAEPFRIGFERAEQPTGNLYDVEIERDCAMRREQWRLAREISSR